MYGFIPRFLAEMSSELCCRYRVWLSPTFLTVNVRDPRARFALVLREAEGAPLCTHGGEGVDQ